MLATGRVTRQVSALFQKDMEQRGGSARSVVGCSHLPAHLEETPAATDSAGEVGFSAKSHYHKYTPAPGVHSLLLKTKSPCMASDAHLAPRTRN